VSFFLLTYCCFFFVEEVLPGPSVKTDEQIISALSGVHVHHLHACITPIRLPEGTF
jgi:hypothetical protein